MAWSLIGVALAIAFMSLLILSEDPRFSWISDVLVFLLFCCLIGSVVLEIRNGRLHPITAGQKRRERWIMTVILLIAITAAFWAFR